MKPFLAKAACQGGDESREQWLSAGENDVLHSGLLRLIYQLLYRGMCPFRFPRGVGSIAKPASEVAAGCSDEKLGVPVRTPSPCRLVKVSEMRTCPLFVSDEACEDSCFADGVNKLSDSDSFRDTLEVFDNPSPTRQFTIVHHCPEFTSVCPKTDNPTTAKLSLPMFQIRYAWNSRASKCTFKGSETKAYFTRRLQTESWMTFWQL